MIPLVIKKMITFWDAMPASERGLQSEFAKKAWADLLAYEEIKAANEANLADLLERPYEDLVREELIDSLPGPKVEDLESENVPLKVKVEGVPMETVSADPAEMDMEGGSLEPESTKDEAEGDIKMEEDHSQEPSPSKKPRTSSDPAAASSEGERGSVEPESFKDLGGDGDDFKNLPKIKDEDVQAAMKKQGTWGDQSTHIDPEDFDLARKASSAPDASKASEINDEFVSTSKRESGNQRNLTSRSLMSTRFSLSRISPLIVPLPLLHWPTSSMDQRLASIRTTVEMIPSTGLSSKHMICRDPKVPLQHPTQKYGCTERLLRDCMKRLDPVYMNRVPKGKILFDAGDVRSSIDDNFLGKSSTAAQRAGSLREELLGKLEDVPGIRSNLQNALLHYFLSCGINKEEVGELIRDDAVASRAMELRERDPN